VTRTAKRLAMALLVGINFFFVYYTMLTGLRKGYAWQRLYLIACIIQFIVEIVMFETMECVWVNCAIPVLVSDEVRRVGDSLTEVIHNLCSNAETDSNMFLNAPDYLFVSTNVAKKFPMLMESILVQAYTTHLPGELARKWQVGSVARIQRFHRARRATLFGATVAVLQYLGTAPFVVQRLFIRFVQPFAFSALVLLLNVIMTDVIYIVVAVLVVLAGVAYGIYRHTIDRTVVHVKNVEAVNAEYQQHQHANININHTINNNNSNSSRHSDGESDGSLNLPSPKGRASRKTHPYNVNSDSVRSSRSSAMSSESKGLSSVTATAAAAAESKRYDEKERDEDEVEDDNSSELSSILSATVRNNRQHQQHRQHKQNGHHRHYPHHLGAGTSQSSQSSQQSALSSIDMETNHFALGRYRSPVSRSNRFYASSSSSSSSSSGAESSYRVDDVDTVEQQTAITSEGEALHDLHTSTDSNSSTRTRSTSQSKESIQHINLSTASS